MGIWNIIYDKYKIIIYKSKTYYYLHIYKNKNIIKTLLLVGENIIQNSIYYFINSYNITNKNKNKNTIEIVFYGLKNYNQFLNKLNDFEKLYKIFIF